MMEPETVARFKREIDAMARHAADDPEAFAQFVQLGEHMDKAGGWAVCDLKACGFSWADIARPLGITRQAAAKRFGGYIAQCDVMSDPA